MPLSKFESMLKTNNVYFFDSTEFEEIIHHYIDNGRHSLAKKAVKLGLEQHPTSMLLRLLKAELYIFENELEKAEKLLNELQAIEPTNGEVYIQKANVYSKKDDHREAIETLNLALKHSEDEADIWSMIGMEYLFLDNFEKARINFAKCLEDDIEDYASLYNVIYCFDMQNKHVEAIAYLKKYIDKNPYCEVAWHQIGRQYFVTGQFTEALKAFDYAVLIDESFIGGYLEKAKTLEKLQCYREAIENYLVTLELDDPTSFVYLRIGVCYEKLKENHLACQYYNKAINEDPLLDKAWMALTNIYFKEENYQKALYYINKALDMDASNSVYWRKFAEINLKLSFYEESIKAFRKCIELNDTNIEIWIALADVLYFIGEFEEAIDTLKQAQLEFTNVAEIEYRLGGLFMLLQNKTIGLSYIKNALNLDFDYYRIIEEMFPTVFDSDDVKKEIFKLKQSL